MYKKPKAAGFHQAAFENFTQKNYSKNQRKFKRIFDRNLLPAPAAYYSKEFANLRIKSKWVKVCCPFHDDHKPSLNINMVYGCFKCWSCGICGGDVLAFQMQRYNQNFKEAVTALNAWEVHKNE